MHRKLNGFSLPVYQDGCFEYYFRKQSDTQFPTDELSKSEYGKIWFREIDVYDRARVQFRINDVEVSLKIRLPYDKRFKPKDFVIIDGIQHEIFNIAYPYEGEFRETEITFVKPNKRLDIKEPQNEES